jgi:hypothetical protein
MQHESARREKKESPMPTSETALLPMQTVEAVVMAYADAQRDVAEAFRLFQQAQVRLKTFLEETV